MSSKFNLLHHRADKCSKLPKIYMIFRTNLGPTAVDLIFFAPKVANLGVWKIVLTNAL